MTLIHNVFINLYVLIDIFESRWDGVEEGENPITKLTWKRRFKLAKDEYEKKKYQKGAEDDFEKKKSEKVCIHGHNWYL